jgi:hypothetical protein
MPDSTPNADGERDTSGEVERWPHFTEAGYERLGHTMVVSEVCVVVGARSFTIGSWDD